ncbi:MAG: hypothetical protein GSR86_00220 [Desulfurococcales archaeon]|nr:hypothetical protein [Desulfurococcales archaeon]
MDVSRDPRLLMAGKALDMLTDSITSWRMPWRIDRNRLAGELKKARKALYTMRYSYTPPTTLAKTEEATIIEETARSIAGEILETPPGTTLTPAQKLAHATNRWALNILGGLKYRLLLGDEPHPEYSVDIVGVEVTRVEELAPGLKATRATTGRTTLTIVTNIQEIKPGEVRAAAILPPRQFHNTISEAMYASPRIEDKYLGKRVPTRLLSPDLRGTIMTILKQ